ncbi:Pr6Pr family membrane protein [Flindersiella endophytica]
MNESAGLRRSSDPVARWCQAGIAIVIAGSLVIQLALIFNGGADANSGDTGESVGLGVRLWRLFSYFTIQSNLIVLAAAVVLAWRPRHDGWFWRVVRLDSLLGIVITGLVYAIVLAPQVHLTGAALVATIGFHYVSPWAALVAWLLFGPRPRMNWATVWAAFGWPVLWLVYTFTHGALTDWYPYPFLDVVDIGLGTAIRNAFVVLVLGVLLALAFKALDGKLPMLRGLGARDRAEALQRPSADSSHNE